LKPERRDLKPETGDWKPEIRKVKEI